MELQRPATVVAAEKGNSTVVKVCRRVWAGALGLRCPAITGSGRRRLCLSADVSATRSPGRFDVPPLAKFCEFTSVMMSLVSGTRLGSDLMGSRRPLESKTAGVSGTSSANNEIRVTRYRARERQTRTGRRTKLRSAPAAISSNYPIPLRTGLSQLANRPHTYLPMQVFAEADKPSQLFQYYLLDTSGFEPNVFTAIIAGVNDANVELTATGANCGLPAVGAMRVVLEPKPDLPTDPTDPNAFIDVFTDISPLFVINNESGWYEGWMIHDITVPNIAPPRPDGHAAFGTITDGDAKILAKMGAHHNVPGNNVPGHIFSPGGQAPRFPSASDKFPDKRTNVVPLQESMGAYNAMQQSDVHSYWEFNYLGTNWIHPLYALPFTGGFPDNFGQAPGAFEDGEMGKLQSIVPGPGPGGQQNKPQAVGDNPNLPRDPDKFDADDDAQREFRQRGIPSFQAALPTRLTLMSTNGWRHSSRMSEISRSACLMPTQSRSYASTRTATGSFPRWKVTSTPRRMALRTTPVSSYRQPRSTASPLPGKSMTDYWHRALPRASVLGC
jgi:hypothetical protein